MSKSNACQPQVMTCQLGTLSTVGSYPVTSLPRGFVVTGVKLLNGATIVADNTNYVTLTLKSGATALATLDTRISAGAVGAGIGGVTSLVSKALLSAAALTGASPVGYVAAGDITVDYGEGGTGTLTSAVLCLEGFFK